MNPLITEARLAAPFSDDGGLLMRLASALESAEKMAEAALEDLADGGRARILTFVDELDALPFESVITDAYGTPYICEKHRVDGSGNEWQMAGTHYLQESQYVLEHGDVTVHYTPEPTP